MAQNGPDFDKICLKISEKEEKKGNQRLCEKLKIYELLPLKKGPPLFCFSKFLQHQISLLQ